MKAAICLGALAAFLAEALPVFESVGGWVNPWAWVLLVCPMPVVVEPFTYKAVSRLCRHFVPEGEK